MKQSKLRLLLLSVGSLAAQNVIDAIGTRREHCVLIGTNSIADAAGNFRCDTAYLVPPAASGAAYIERIAEVIRQEQPDLVIPTRDDDVLALAILGEQSPRIDTVLLTGSVAAALVMNDKVETARFAARHGLPFAPTAANTVEALDLAAIHKLPLIGKPRRGNGSRGVVLLRSTAEIERAFESKTDLIAQPFLDPPADIDALIAPFESGLPFFFSFPESGRYAVQVIVGPGGAISKSFGAVSTQFGGQAIFSRRCDDADLLDVCRAYAVAAAVEGWKGPLSVQLKRTSEGAFVAFEMDGRVGGGTAARMFMGFDDVAEVIERFVPEAAFSSIATNQSDAVQKNLSSYPIPREGVAALRTSGRWSRAGRD